MPADHVRLNHNNSKKERVCVRDKEKEREREKGGGNSPLAECSGVVPHQIVQTGAYNQARY